MKKSHKRTYYVDQPQRRCPRCGSTRATKAGHNYSRRRGVHVQRWHCRGCGAGFMFGSLEYYDVFQET